MNSKKDINLKKLPQHIAVIMDGNGRWAKKQGLLRVAGHQKGTDSVRETVEACAELGIKHLTLYAFSTENWNRPKIEVKTLMKILVSSLRKELTNFEKNNIKLNTIGCIESLPEKAQVELNEVISKTANNTAMTLTLALSYGAREELIQTMKIIAEKTKNNEIGIDQINEDLVNKHLYTVNLPDVDLMIRTSGEQRISNFLLWQMAYAEFYFTPTLWPDFKKEDLFEAIFTYQKRERRFGKTSEQL